MRLAAHPPENNAIKIGRRICFRTSSAASLIASVARISAAIVRISSRSLSDTACSALQCRHRSVSASSLMSRPAPQPSHEMTRGSSSGRSLATCKARLPSNGQHRFDWRMPNDCGLRGRAPSRHECTRSSSRTSVLGTCATGSWTTWALSVVVVAAVLLRIGVSSVVTNRARHVPTPARRKRPES